MRAPQLAVELLRWALEETPADDVARDALVLGLVRALIAVGGYEEAVRQASPARLNSASDTPAHIVR
jgi:hypothetical protein